MAQEVCKNFERNRPLVGANEFFRLCDHVVLHTSKKYAYQLIDLLILNNFASRTIAVNQTVHLIFANMLKTYFCELVLGFLPNRNQTSLGQFYGLSRSIIIKKKLNFCIFRMANRVI